MIRTHSIAAASLQGDLQSMQRLSADNLAVNLGTGGQYRYRRLAWGQCGADTRTGRIRYIGSCREGSGQVSGYCRCAHANLKHKALSLISLVSHLNTSLTSHPLSAKSCNAEGLPPYVRYTIHRCHLRHFCFIVTIYPRSA